MLDNKTQVNNMSLLVEEMTGRQIGRQTLSEPMITFKCLLQNGGHIV